MITFPPEFVKIKYPGYFWNINDKKLYSIKVSGELTPLTFYKGGFFFGRHIPDGYRISVRGWRKTITVDYLNTLQPKDETVDIKNEQTS